MHVGGNPINVLFDSGTSHCLLTPEVASNFKGTFVVKKVSVSISVRGSGTYRADNLVLGVLLVVQGESLLSDLLVVPLGNYEVILGMDWLSVYFAKLDCGHGRVTFEREGHPTLAYYGISPSKIVVCISAMRIKKILEEGESYLVALTCIGEAADMELRIEDILVVRKIPRCVPASGRFASA